MKTLKFKRGDRVFVKLYGEPKLLQGVVSQLFPFHEKYRVALEDGQVVTVKKDTFKNLQCVRRSSNNKIF